MNELVELIGIDFTSYKTWLFIGVQALFLPLWHQVDAALNQ